MGLKGDTGDEDLRRFKKYGADDVLPKPFNVDDLNGIIRLFKERKTEESIAQQTTGVAEEKAGKTARLRVLVVDDSGSTR